MTDDTPLPMPQRVSLIPTSHLDLFWLGDYRRCLSRGDEVLGHYIDRCLQHPDETFQIDTVIFLEHFLDSHPEREADVRRLFDEGRLEVGAAYVDRWENLVCGETLIRNIRIGQQVLADRLDLRTRLVIHPDLPGLNTQMAQICAQAGIDFYVTARKLHQEGRVWRLRGPDGSGLVVMTWPMFYVFVPFSQSDIPPHPGRNFTRGRTLPLEGLAERYPLGHVGISAGAGDLTDSGHFQAAYGLDVRELLENCRRRYPQTDWRFGIAADLLAPYAAPDAPPLAEVREAVPSVWGVGATEDFRLIPAFRRNEALLLAAESAAGLALLDGRPAIPSRTHDWRGAYGEIAFFADAFCAHDDPPVRGAELDWLWRMHLFVQDHNGGGMDGVLSTFQKQLRADRQAEYCRQILTTALDWQQAGGQPALFNPVAGRAEGPLVTPPEPQLQALAAAHPGAAQTLTAADGSSRLALAHAPLTGLGLHPLVPVVPGGRLDLVTTPAGLRAESAHLRLELDAATGAARLTDTAGGQVWAGLGSRIEAHGETGSDVTLRMDRDRRRTSRLLRVEPVAAGPLAVQIRVTQDLLDARWTTLYTLWADQPRLEVEGHVAWHGERGWQIRLPLADGIAPERVTYGTPFHCSPWPEAPAALNPGFNVEEILPEDHPNYREAVHWLHLAGEAGGLTLTTDHAAFALDAGALSAVLMRTVASVGDPRLHCAHAGVNTWSFTLQTSPADWRAARAAALGQARWRTPLPGFVAELPDGPELTLDQPDVVVSALQPTPGGKGLELRLANLCGEVRQVRLGGRLARLEARLTDLQGRDLGAVPREGAGLVLDLGPWKLATMTLTPKDTA